MFCYNPRIIKPRIIALSSRLSRLALCVVLSVTAQAQTPDSATLLNTLVEHESAAIKRWPPYRYLSHERSARTGGHLWTEQVAETPFGKVKILISIDSKPLTAEQAAKEQARLAEIAAHPDTFRKHEQAERTDDLHSMDLLAMLPRACLFDAPTQEGPYLRIAFRPNPRYQTQSIEERILHSMTGSLLIEPKTVRLRAIEGRMPADLNIGFGILATIKSGSNFHTTRQHIEADEWKMETMDTDINGRIIFFKTIAKADHAIHSDFHRIPDGLTPAQAIDLLRKQPQP